MANNECLAKLGALKVSHVTGTTQAGKDFDFYSVDRSYKNEQTGKWESQSITLKPTELLAVASLLQIAGERLAKQQAYNFNNPEKPVEIDGVPF